MEIERPLFDQAGVTVTKTRFSVPGRTYPIQGINLVEFVAVRPNLTLAALCIGGVIVFLGSAAACTAFANFFPAGFCLLMAAVCAGLAWHFRSEFRPSFAVALTTASGRAECFRTFDRQMAEGVVAAINSAIVWRG